MSDIVERLRFELRDWDGVSRFHFPAVNALVINEAAETILALRAAINDVLTHRHGDLPTLGYIRDNDKSRAAIARLAALATEAE